MTNTKKHKIICYGTGGGHPKNSTNLIQVNQKIGIATTPLNFEIEYWDEETQKYYPFYLLHHLEELNIEEIEKYFKTLNENKKIKMLNYLLTKKELPKTVEEFFSTYKNKKEYKLRLLFSKKEKNDGKN